MPSPAPGKGGRPHYVQLLRRVSFLQPSLPGQKLGNARAGLRIDPKEVEASQGRRPAGRGEGQPSRGVLRVREDSGDSGRHRAVRRLPRCAVLQVRGLPGLIQLQVPNLKNLYKVLYNLCL